MPVKHHSYAAKAFSNTLGELCTIRVRVCVDGMEFGCSPTLVKTIPALAAHAES